MPRIKPISPDEITESILKAFEEHKREHNARITNMKATMGKSLPVFKVYMRWYDLYKEVIDAVGERSAYLFAYAISEGSNCPLCSTFFRKIIIENKENPEKLSLSNTDKILLDFGSAIANNKGVISAELYKKVYDNFTEDQIIVLVGFAGQMIATNIFNNVLEVQIDDYLAPYIPLTR